MKHSVTYDPIRMDLMVGEQTLREFYIEQRQDAGITIPKLTADACLNHGQLRNMELLQKNGKYSNATMPILAALDTLGFEISIEG